MGYYGVLLWFVFLSCSWLSLACPVKGKESGKAQVSGGAAEGTGFVKPLPERKLY